MTKTMIKNKVTRWTQALLLALATVLFAASSSYAQTITTTFANNNGSSVVVFSISNNSATSSYLLTDIGSLAGFTGTGTARLYAKAATYGVAPGAVGAVTAANGWTDIGSNTALVTTSNTSGSGAAATTWISGMSYMLPPLSQVRFCLQHVSSGGAASFSTTGGSIRYSTVGVQTCLYTSGDIELNACANYGYGGTMASPTNSPRGFIGFINYTSAAPCSGTPTPGNTTGPSSACPGQPFTLGLQNTTSGTGVTYLWESADDAAFTLGVTTIGTGNTATASQTSDKFYRCLVDCGGNSAYSNVLNVTMNNFLGCYCIPTTTNGCASGDHITNVTFTSSGSPINNTTGACLSASYSDYTAQQATVMQGDIVPVSVSVNNGGTEYAAGWIDYDQSGTFDASEYIALTDADGIAPWIYTANVTIPVTATVGITGMRFRSSYAATIAPNSACGTYSFGETEDYRIDIMATTACTGTPAPGNTIASAASVCPGSPVTLSLQNLTPGTGVTYQWESADDAAFTLNVQTLGTSPFQTANPTTPTYYRCLVDCGGNSAYSVEVLVGINAFLNCYCATGLGGSCGINAMSSVEIVTTTLNNVTGGCTGPYNAFPQSGSTTASLLAGNPYTMNVGVISGSNTQVAIWIDYNQNGTFETSEYTLINGNIPSGSTGSGSFTIPITALAGSTGMRVRSDWQGTTAWTSADACTNRTWGETEDYIIDVILPSACSGTPAPGNTVASVASVCPGGSVLLSLQNPNLGTGIIYQWESADDAAFTINVQNLGTNSTQTANPTTPTYYRCLVDCGGNSAYSTEVLVNINSFLLCYACTPIPSNAADEEIYSVTVGAGSTDPLYAGAAGCTTVAPGPGSILNRYSNFKTLAPITSVMQGDIVPFTVEENECDGATFYSFGTGIWIDYNQDGDFDDFGEEVFKEGTTLVGPRNVTGTFTVPFTALTGTTVMRVIVAEGYAGATLTPCLTYGYGETEEFLIDITPSSPCSGTPSPGNTIATATTFCPPASPINLSLQNATPGTGVTYQWEQADDQAFTIGVVALGTAPTQSVTPSQASTWYRCLVDCGGNSAYSVEVEITQNAPNQCYCTPVYTTGKTAGDLISNVVISGTTLSNNTGTAAVNPAYTYFPASLGASYTANMTAGNTYNVSVTIGSFSNQGIAVWIDLNANGIFETPSERIGFTSGTIGTAFGTGTFPITIPCNPTPGTYRMRVRENYAMSGGLIDPCATYTWGECEDYDVTIDPPLPCPAPSAFALVSGSETATGANFNWNIGCVETAWNLEFGLTGFTPGTGTVVPVTTNTNAAISTMACGTTYDVYVQADCGGAGPSTWVGPVSVTTGLCPCTTPAPGNTIANATSVCPTDNLVLSLQNATTGSGVTYQWYSSPDGITYSPVGTGAATYTTTQAATTYYYCDVTCATGPTTVSSTPVMVGMNAATQCYCASAAQFTSDEEIYSVTVGTGSTDPLYAGTNGCTTAAPGPGSALSLYSNFTTLGALTNMTVGSSVPFTIVEDECDGATYYPFGTAIWIDYNQDGDFDDAGEEAFMESATAVGPRNITGNISVPLTATTGLTRMRITVSEGNAGTGILTPCLSYGYGETEDFLVNIVPNNASLLATFIIQGYYDANTGNMQPVYLNSGVGVSPTEADLVTVSLHDASAPYAQVHTFSGIQNINGQITCTFPGSAVGNSYYIVLTNRNAVETWSANPVLISASTSYDFTSSAAQAYGANQIDVSGTGLFAIYNGDVNQDEVVDGLDFNDWEIDNNNFAGGYVTTDFNGDGVVDGLDFLVWEPNNNNFVGTIKP